MTDDLFLDVCREQYHALFEMSRTAIGHCPDNLWDARGDEPPFWQQALHTLWAVDFYLSESPDRYRPPTLATKGAQNLKIAPDDTPSKRQIQLYLGKTRRRCDAFLDGLAKGGLDAENPFGWTGPTVAHRMVYSLRHAQHHVGWMNSILSRRAEKAADWVCRRQ